jgi:hypothetical protein
LFFLAVGVLSRLFQRLFLGVLSPLIAPAALQFFGDDVSLAAGDAFAAYLAPLRNLCWRDATDRR